LANRPYFLKIDNINALLKEVAFRNIIIYKYILDRQTIFNFIKGEEL